MELAKREYIDKLKRELEGVEEKWQQIAQRNSMVGEDYRSSGLRLMGDIQKLA